MACKYGFRPDPDGAGVECEITNKLCVACSYNKFNRRHVLDLEVMSRCPKCEEGVEQ